MDCWVRVPCVGGILGQINSGGKHESVHRSKFAFQRLQYYRQKKVFSHLLVVAMSWKRCTSTNLGPLVPFPLTVNVSLISVITIALVKQM